MDFDFSGMVIDATVPPYMKHVVHFNKTDIFKS